MMPFWNRKKAEAATAAKGHAVYVGPAGEHWVVRLNGHWDRQSAAELVGRAIASLLDLELEIRGRDGQIREKDSHGHDDPDVPG